MSSILSSFFAAAFLFVLVQSWWRRRRLLRGLAVPPGASWVWGHEKQIFEAETGTKYTAWANELGPTYKIKSPWLVRPVHSTWHGATTTSLRAILAPRHLGYSRPRSDQPYLLKKYVQLSPFTCISTTYREGYRSWVRPIPDAGNET